MLVIEMVTPQKAVEELRALGMRIDVRTMHRGIRQGVYPFGICILGDDDKGEPVYQIFRRQLDEWIDERATEVQ